MKNLLETVISDYKINNTLELRNWQLQAMKNLERLIGNRPISVLVDATCGSGKSTVQHMAIDYVARLKEAEGKKAMILLASPRLLLNEQLLKCCKSNIKDFDDRFTVLNMASNDLGEAKFDMPTSTGFGISNKLNSNKHIILLACDTSVNMDFDNAARQIESRIMNLASHRTKNGHEVTFDLAMIDEAHKDIDNSVLLELKKMSNTLITYTATPSKRLSKICSTKRITYGFRQAIKDGVVVPPSLYLISKTNKLKEKDKATSIVASIKHLINEAENTQKLGYDRRAVEVVFDNSIDYLRNYENTLRSIYTIDALDIAILASEKEVAIKNQHGERVKKYEIYSSFNGEKLEDAEVLEKVRNSKKHTIILSAYKVQEGIDIKAINGVCILCDKRENNLYQAICRGDRTAPGKKKFNIYITADSDDQIHDFLDKMVEGFESEIDFGDGIELGAGKEVETEEVDISALKSVVPMAIRYRNAIVKAVEEYKAENEIQIASEAFKDEAWKMWHNGDEIGKIWTLFARDEFDHFSATVEDDLVNWVENELFSK
jgi:superfamily II DNA or RNA helicase